MKLTPNKALTQHLFEKMAEYLAKGDRGEDIHVSDLLYPMKSYQQKVNPLPLTQEEILYYIAGRSHHQVLVAGVAGVDDTQEESFIDEELGISYSPDLSLLKAEIKTNRSHTVPDTKEKVRRLIDGYIGQCKSYASMLKERGELVDNTFNLVLLFLAPVDPQTRRKVPKLRSYSLQFSDNELSKQREYLRETKAALLDAISRKDPSALSLCPMWQCASQEPREDGEITNIPRCKFWESCKPEGRYGV